MGHFWITKWIQRAWYCWGITFPRWGYPYGPFPCNPLGLLWHRRCGRRTAAADVGRKSQALRIPPLWFHNFHLPTLVLAMKLAWSHISEGWFWVRPPQHCIGNIEFDFEGYVICFRFSCLCKQNIASIRQFCAWRPSKRTYSTLVQAWFDGDVAHHGNFCPTIWYSNPKKIEKLGT